MSKALGIKRRHQIEAEYTNLESMANAIVSANYSLIGINLLITCIAIVGVYFHARIKKSAELHEINTNFKTVLKQQKELTEETEKIRHALGKEAIGYQIKLHSYNEKSIDAINCVYISIIKLREAARNLGFNPTDDAKKEFQIAIHEFQKEYDIKRIWLPIELSKHLREVAFDIDKKSFKFIRANTIQNMRNLSDEKIQKLLDDQEAFYDYLGDEIHTVFETLVNKISNEINASNA